MYCTRHALDYTENGNGSPGLILNFCFGVEAKIKDSRQPPTKVHEFLIAEFMPTTLRNHDQRINVL
jgi:hypothetical protein